MSLDTDVSLRALSDPRWSRSVEREAGLVETEAAGRYTYYRLLPEALATVAAHYGDLTECARHASQIRRPCS